MQHGLPLEQVFECNMGQTGRLSDPGPGHEAPEFARQEGAAKGSPDQFHGFLTRGLITLHRLSPSQIPFTYLLFWESWSSLYLLMISSAMLLGTGL